MWLVSWYLKNRHRWWNGVGEIELSLKKGVKEIGWIPPNEQNKTGLDKDGEVNHIKVIKIRIPHSNDSIIIAS